MKEGESLTDLTGEDVASANQPDRARRESRLASRRRFATGSRP